VTAPPGNGTPAGPRGRGRLRASHADREHVVGMLKAAFVEGRLTKDEFDLRVGQTLTSRTYTELAALTADLPPELIAAPPQRKPARPPRNEVAKPGARVTIVAATLGLLAGIASVTLTPPTFTSSAFVVLPPATGSVATQVAIAGSDPVLWDALHSVKPAMSLQTLRSDIQVKGRTPTIISISAHGETATQAERTAGAVADSYVAYVSSGRSGRQVQPRILEPAAITTETPSPMRLLALGGLGALLGALIGAIGAHAFIPSDRRFAIQ
jgi:DUF1707 SHOCT-like domain